MNPFIPLLFFLPLSLSSSSSSSAHAPSSATCKIVAGVETTCKTVSAFRKSIPYDYCVSSFHSVPTATQEDLPGLAAVAARLAMHMAESTETWIGDLAEQEPHDAPAKNRYDECQDAFNDAGDSLRDALDSIVAKQYAKAARLLRASHGAGNRCEKAFETEQAVNPPVMEADREYEMLAEIAEAIVSMVDN